MENKFDRGTFINAVSFGGVGLALGHPHIVKANAENGKPAILGGPKAHPNIFPSWPMSDQTGEKALLEVINSKAWHRNGGTSVEKFEKEYAKILEAKHCLAVCSGTNSLYTMMGALDVGLGDEALFPCHTFVARGDRVSISGKLCKYENPN
jgi:hypothetical protein